MDPRQTVSTVTGQRGHAVSAFDWLHPRPVCAAAALLTAATAGAAEPSRPEGAGCPGPMPPIEPTVDYYADRMSAHTDWRTNPEHTREELKQSTRDMDAAGRCLQLMDDGGSVAVLAYQAHQRGETGFTRAEHEKRSSLDGEPPGDPREAHLFHIETEVVDLAYQGVGADAIADRLYCKCFTGYPKSE